MAETARGAVTGAQPEHAKLRRGGRELVADLAVQQRVVDELQTLADQKLGELYADETRLRLVFERLGLPADEAWKHGRLDFEAAAALLGEETPAS